MVSFSREETLAHQVGKSIYSLTPKLFCEEKAFSKRYMSQKKVFFRVGFVKPEKLFVRVCLGDLM